MLDAMGNVVAQDLFLDPPQRGTRCGDLCDHINAITVSLDHPGEAPDLAFNSLEPLQARRLDLTSHAPNIPLQGIGSSGEERDG